MKSKELRNQKSWRWKEDRSSWSTVKTGWLHLQIVRSRFIMPWCVGASAFSLQSSCHLQNMPLGRLSCSRACIVKHHLVIHDHDWPSCCSAIRQHLGGWVRRWQVWPARWWHICFGWSFAGAQTSPACCFISRASSQDLLAPSVAAHGAASNPAPRTHPYGSSGSKGKGKGKRGAGRASPPIPAELRGKWHKSPEEPICYGYNCRSGCNEKGIKPCARCSKGCISMRGAAFSTRT